MDLNYIEPTGIIRFIIEMEDIFLSLPEGAIRCYASG